jgi:hypothetical protein
MPGARTYLQAGKIHIIGEHGRCADDARDKSLAE